MFSAVQLTTPPDPQQVAVYLALHLGVSATLVGIVVWLVGLSQVTKSWSSAAKTVGVAAVALKKITEDRKQAAALLGFYAALVVGLSYMLALLVNALIIIYQVNQNGISSWSAVESTMSGATWPPAASWTVSIEAAAFVLYLLAMSADLAPLRGLITFVIYAAVFACAVATLGMVFGMVDDWIAPASQNLGNNREALFQTQLFIAIICVTLAALLMGITSAVRSAFKPSRF